MKKELENAGVSTAELCMIAWDQTKRINVSEESSNSIQFFVLKRDQHLDRCFLVLEIFFLENKFFVLIFSLLPIFNFSSIHPILRPAA